MHCFDRPTIKGKLATRPFWKHIKRRLKKQSTTKTKLKHFRRLTFDIVKMVLGFWVRSFFYYFELWMKLSYRIFSSKRLLSFQLNRLQRLNCYKWVVYDSRIIIKLNSVLYVFQLNLVFVGCSLNTVNGLTYGLNFKHHSDCCCSKVVDCVQIVKLTKQNGFPFL